METIMATMGLEVAGHLRVATTTPTRHSLQLGQTHRKAATVVPTIHKDATATLPALSSVKFPAVVMVMSIQNSLLPELHNLRTVTTKVGATHQHAMATTMATMALEAVECLQHVEMDIPIRSSPHLLLLRLLILPIQEKNATLVQITATCYRMHVGQTAERRFAVMV